MDGRTDGGMMNVRVSERAGESCKRPKWNVIRAASQSADITEENRTEGVRPIPDRCGAIGIEHAALTKPTIASNWRWRKEERKEGRKETRK